MPLTWCWQKQCYRNKPVLLNDNNYWCVIFHNKWERVLLHNNSRIYKISLQEHEQKYCGILQTHLVFWKNKYSSNSMKTIEYWKYCRTNDWTLGLLHGNNYWMFAIACELSWNIPNYVVLTAHCWRCHLQRHWSEWWECLPLGARHLTPLIWVVAPNLPFSLSLLLSKDKACVTIIIQSQATPTSLTSGRLMSLTQCRLCCYYYSYYCATWIKYFQEESLGHGAHRVNVKKFSICIASFINSAWN